ncbi:hypothetical protein SADUNF_Sadunf16G0013200 [Salix dunnii]|uniref:Uncharacterized protein n=1 Tax=Salix dunnii TaxID=1413687 RepID=A0A835MKL4_9ROSI|nr:hypothetical protein SADUNF_Sadunf16G0013200 [Salix dunnii]
MEVNLLEQKKAFLKRSGDGAGDDWPQVGENCRMYMHSQDLQKEKPQMMSCKGHWIRPVEMEVQIAARYGGTNLVFCQTQ